MCSAQIKVAMGGARTTHSARSAGMLANVRAPPGNPGNVCPRCQAPLIVLCMALSMRMASSM